MPEMFTGDTIAAAMTGTASAVTDPPPSDASPASDPTLPAAEASSAGDAATTVQAGADGSQETTVSDPTKTTDTKGVPPEDRWPAILTNARTKAADEVKAQFAWAERIPEQHRATVGEFYSQLETEPVQAIEALIATTANDPTHAPQLRSLMGRLLRGATPESQPVTTGAKPAALPEPDFEDEQGHQFFSAARVRESLQALETKLDAKYATQLDPLKRDLETRAARAERVKQQKAADDWAAARYDKVSQWPEFKAHEKEIAAAIAADPSLEIGDAYVAVVVPKLSQVERKKVVSHEQFKASASAANPGSPASAVSRPPRTFEEGLRQMGVGG